MQTITLILGLAQYMSLGAVFGVYLSNSWAVTFNWQGPELLG
jgi:hypothetical protein